MKWFNTALVLPLALQASALATPPATRSSTTSVLKPRLDINDILAWITSLFPVNVTLEAAASVIEAADTALATALGYMTTYEQLSNGQCGDVTLIFARGTDEPGNVGALVGPEFYAALEGAVGSGTSVVFQGVDDYDATVTEYLEGGSTTGAADMSVSLPVFPFPFPFPFLFLFKPFCFAAQQRDLGGDGDANAFVV